jgi:rhodanese-related sulfurtransferase
MSGTITPAELKNHLKEKKKDLVILDVRRKADYEADPKIIPGAIWRDPEEVDQWSGELPKDKDIAIYCVRGGSISKSVASRLIQEKVQASILEGGITAWKELGGKVEEK